MMRQKIEKNGIFFVKITNMANVELLHHIDVSKNL